jgi:hypothetical protein
VSPAKARRPWMVRATAIWGSNCVALFFVLQRCVRARLADGLVGRNFFNRRHNGSRIFGRWCLLRRTRAHGMPDLLIGAKRQQTDRYSQDVLRVIVYRAAWNPSTV